MPNRRGSQRRRQERRENKRVERELLHAAIKDLRAAVIDEDAGNDHVRDCAFEVVEAYERAVAPEHGE